MDFINRAKLFESVCKIGRRVDAVRDLPFFELIEKDYKFDLKSDLDKIKTKEISKKLLSYLDKYKTDKKDTDNIVTFFI